MAGLTPESPIETDSRSRWELSARATQEAIRNSNSALCEKCRNISYSGLPEEQFVDADNSAGYEHHDIQRLLESTMKDCRLCIFLWRIVKSWKYIEHDEVPDHLRGTKLCLTKYFAPDYITSSIVLSCYPDKSIMLIDVLGEESSPAALAEKNLSFKAADDRSLAQCGDVYRKWIQGCIAKHKKCRNDEDVFLPKRVLDVGPADGSCEPRLLETSRRCGKYVTLTHCWGGKIGAVTTTANLSARQDAVKMADLPPTFRDAIIVTRQLNELYLWIDSLCIIQDDSRDWAEQSAVMGDVYMNSTANINAAWAANSNEGFLNRRAYKITCEIPYKSALGVTSGSLFMQWQPSFTAICPVNDRGWTLQEAILSPRTLHYNRDETIFVCRELKLLENGVRTTDIRVTTDGINQRLKRAIVEISDPLRTKYFHWATIVCEFTSRNLTFSTDKLPALAGLAQVFSRHADEKYLAGLWLGDLPISLLWTPSNIKQCQQVKPYRAPSWSWASMDGPIGMGCKLTRQSPEKDLQSIDASVVSASTELDGPNPFGAVRSGEIVIEGSLWPALAVSTLPDEGHPYYLEGLDPHGADSSLDSPSNQMGGTRFPAQVGFDAGAVPSDPRVWCLQVVLVRGDIAYDKAFENLIQPQGLVLQETSNSGIFVRIGVYQFALANDDWVVRKGVRRTIRMI